MIHNPNFEHEKIKRVMQITKDLLKTPLAETRILDFGCGHGWYSIQAALLGAEVLGMDGRTVRMKGAITDTEKLGLKLAFEQVDIRQVSVLTHGRADVIFFLGILYHLDAPEVFRVLGNVHAMCRQFVIIDTHTALSGGATVEYLGEVYQGESVVEHSEEDSQAVRLSRQKASLDNAFSFYFTRESLFRLLGNTGFTSVYQCQVPHELQKPVDRITLVAMKGEGNGKKGMV